MARLLEFLKVFSPEPFDILGSPPMFLIILVFPFYGDANPFPGHVFRSLLHAAQAARCNDFVLPLNQIPAKLKRLAAELKI
mgnify:CR=1 FL=1